MYVKLINKSSKYKFESLPEHITTVQISFQAEVVLFLENRKRKAHQRSKLWCLSSPTALCISSTYLFCCDYIAPRAPGIFADSSWVAPLGEDGTIFVGGIKYVSYHSIVRHSGAIMMQVGWLGTDDTSQRKLALNNVRKLMYHTEILKSFGLNSKKKEFIHTLTG